MPGAVVGRAGRGLVVAAAVLLAAVLGGCAAGPIAPSSHDPAVVSGRSRSVSAQDVLDRHNIAVRRLDRLWSRSSLKLRWQVLDDPLTPPRRRGKVFREQAEGKLILARDAGGTGLHGTAVTAGRLGVTGFWAGSDGRRAWLFDLRDQPVAWVVEDGRLPTEVSGYLPVPPQLLPWVMDMLPISAASAVASPRRTEGGYWEVRPVKGVRMLLDPRTGRAVRVFVQHPDGGDAVAVHLKRFRPVWVAGMAKADRPLVPTRLDIYVMDPGRPAHLEVKLEGVTDQRIRPGLFDLDVLMQQHRPVRVIEGDGRG